MSASRTDSSRGEPVGQAGVSPADAPMSEDLLALFRKTRCAAGWPFRFALGIA